MSARSSLARLTRPLRGLPPFVRHLLIATAGVAIGGFLFAWSGLFNVAASRGHFAAIELALSFVMRNSVETHALTVPAPPPLDPPDLAILGAGYFQRGCAPCHGAPGQQPNAASRTMLPTPPDVTDTSARWSDRELFFIVKHGIKYTGMPAWTSQDRDDEVWALVAFLKQLPDLDARRYEILAFGAVADPDPLRDTVIAGCAACHGDGDRAPRSRLVPVLHGQPAAFLQSALQAYAAGTRHSGIMQPIATDLSDRAIASVAGHYARLAPPSRPAPSAPGGDAERGGRLVSEGRAADAIPPCASCHGANARETFPRLAGQNAAYMASRLRLLRSGIDANSDAAAIMAPIARAMSDRDIDDASAYYSALAPERKRP